MREFNVNYIFSKEKIEDHFFSDDEFAKFFIYWVSDILKKDGFDISLYFLYHATIELVGYLPYEDKFKPNMLILKYIEKEPDYEDDELDLLDYIHDKVQERLVAVPSFKEFAITNPFYLENYYDGAFPMAKIGFEIFHDMEKQGYKSLSVRRKWEGYP